MALKVGVVVQVYNLSTCKRIANLEYIVSSCLKKKKKEIHLKENILYNS
jgi:hypothetical protein